MLHDDLDAVSAAQMFRHLLRKIHGAMLAAGAAERHHHVLESAATVTAHAAIHQRHHVFEKLLHALLLLKIVDHGRVFPSEILEALLASRVRQASAIENESAAVSGFILGQP